MVWAFFAQEKIRRGKNRVLDLHSLLSRSESLPDSRTLNGQEQKSNSIRAACSPLVMRICCIAKECFLWTALNRSPVPPA